LPPPPAAEADAALACAGTGGMGECATEEAAEAAGRCETDARDTEFEFGAAPASAFDAGGAEAGAKAAAESSAESGGAAEPEAGGSERFTLSLARALFSTELAKLMRCSAASISSALGVTFTCAAPALGAGKLWGEGSCALGLGFTVNPSERWG
jgi:hypothetical protein